MKGVESMETKEYEFKAGDRISVTSKSGDMRTGTIVQHAKMRLKVIWDGDENDSVWFGDLKKDAYCSDQTISLLGRTKEVIDLFGMLAEEIYFGLNMKCVMCDAKPETLGALRGFVTKAKSERTKVSKT